MSNGNSTDRITILRASGALVLAKTHLPDGSIKAYDSPKNYTHRTEQVSGIDELHALLDRQASRPQECVIRGGYIGDEFAVPVMSKDPDWKHGKVLRQKEIFRDRVLHAVMIDVDKFTPSEDPLSSDATDEFIATHLSPEFHGVTYRWHLSSSAGRSPMLKAHLWFWLATPYTSDQLAAWRRTAGLDLVDAAVFREVQPHYTADPVMAPGVVDPLAGRRSGLVRGFRDDVPLVLSGEVLRPPVERSDAADRDPVAALLHDRGMVRGERPNGNLDVECPRQHLHTDATTSTRGCEYMPAGTKGYTHGNFSCMHASCAGVPQSAFLTALGLPGRVAAPVDPAVFGAGLAPGATAEAPAGRVAHWTTAPAEGWRGTPMTDLDLQQEIAQLPTGEADIPTLWNGGTAGLPEVQVLPKLVNLIAFRTGGDCERVLALMQRHPAAAADPSGLRAIIQTECAAFARWWAPIHARGEAQRAETAAIGEGLGESILPTVMTIEQMFEHLVYVEQGRAVVNTQTGRAHKWPDAVGVYAASVYEMEGADGKTKQKKCLLAWESTSTRKSVDVLTWAPGRAAFCAPPEAVAGNSRAYNRWRGLMPYAAPADWRERAQPFLDHIAYLVPDEAQRGRFLQWLAHILQRPGELPHTAYLMFTRATGVGRNWVAGVLARVLSGYMASGVALGPLLDGKFNGRLSQKLLATVDETREGMGDAKYTRAEALKRIITEEFRHIDPKYGIQEVQFNCCRWLMFSNHKDALPIDMTDRRVEVIENPDYAMPPDYYARLYGLWRDQAFVLSVRHLLETYDLTGFNAGAPATMSAAKQAAIESVTSEVDLALAAFAAEYPGTLAVRADIDQFVAQYLGEPHVKRAAVNHAMDRLRWTRWGTRVNLPDGKKVNVVSMDPLVGDAELRAIKFSDIADAVHKSRGAFVGGQFLGH